MGDRVLTEAIVFSSKEKGENSRLVTLFTKSEGVKYFTVYGYSSKKNEYKASLQPFTEVVLEYEKDKRNDRILSVKIKDSHDGLKKNYSKIESAYFVSKVVIGLKYLDLQEFNDIFILVHKFLLKLDTLAKEKIDLVEMYFVFSLAYCLGIRVCATKTCISCGETVNLNYFSLDTGNLLCKDCSEGEMYSYKLDEKMSNTLIRFASVKFNDLDKLSMSNLCKKSDFFNFFNIYFRNHFDKNLI